MVDLLMTLPPLSTPAFLDMTPRKFLFGNVPLFIRPLEYNRKNEALRFFTSVVVWVFVSNRKKNLIWNNRKSMVPL